MNPIVRLDRSSILVLASEPEEFDAQIRFLPL